MGGDGYKEAYWGCIILVYNLKAIKGLNLVLYLTVRIKR